MKNIVEQLRKVRGLNQDEFAKILRVSRQTISSIEIGKYNPSLELAFAIAEFFGKQIEEIFIYERGGKNEKTNLVTGVLYVIFGVVFLIVALMIETKLEGILWGFAGAGILPGMIMICTCFFWTSLKNKKRYKERLDNEHMEQHDELKTKIRNKAGRYTYILGLMIIYLGGYLIFQVIAGIVIFNKPMRKY